jgi:hypothetical protein
MLLELVEVRNSVCEVYFGVKYSSVAIRIGYPDWLSGLA